MITGRRPSIAFLFLGDPSHDRRVQNFRRYFEDQGWAVELIAGVTEGGVLPECTTLPIRAKRGPRRFLEYSRRLQDAVQRLHVDVVLACDLYSLSAAATMRRKNRARMLVYDAREVYTELPTVVSKPWARRSWRRIERTGLRVTDCVLLTAPHDAQAVLDVHHFLPRSALVRNLPLAEPLEQDRSRLSEFSIPVGSVVLVYIGGLQAGRGLKQVIESIRGNSCHLLLIGNGVLQQELKGMASAHGVADRVHFAGARNSAEAMQMVAACDVGVSLVEPISPSYELALPSKIFEYMMAGIPIVSSRLRHVEELFARAPWMTFADARDPGSIERAIESAVAAAQDVEMRAAERKVALAEYQFEQDARNLMAVIHRSIEV